MWILLLEIDRTDVEVTIVKAFIDWVKINDDYFNNPTITDQEIETDIRADLITKGYVLW